nr:leucine-rich repeat domain-containing protein [Treponema sp.]
PQPEPEKPQPEPEKPQPEPEKPQPEPEKPQPEPEKPQPEPEKPQPEPEKPQPEPEKPQPEPEKPQPEPEKPQPEPEKPQPEPEKPQPEPEKPKPEPEKPRIPRSVEIAKRGKAIPCKNYEYETGDFTSADKCYIWDFSEYISDPGQYTILFNYQSGSGIVISEAAVLVDGNLFAAFPLEKQADRSSRKARYSFKLPSKAKSVQFTAFVRTIEKGKFYGTIDVIHDRTLIIPRGRKVILYEEFSERNDFNKVKFPNTIVEIGGHSLERTPLERIEVPGNVRKIGNFAFFDMKNLQEVVMHEGVEEMGEYCIDTRDYNLVTVTVPDSMSVFGRFCITNNSVWKINRGSKADEYAKKQRFVSIKYLNVTFAEPPDQQLVMPQEAVVPAGTMKNYAYETGDFTTSESSYVWDFSAYVKNSGNYSIIFSRRSGAYLIMSNAVIIADGKQVASVPQSQTADMKNRIAISFNLPSNARKVELKATARMSRSGTYNGTVDILMGSTLIIPTGRTSIERDEYYKRSDFTSVMFPPSLTEIGSSSFEGCSVKTLDIPGTVKKLDRYAFFGCNSLTEVKLQEGVSELGEWVFCGTKNKFRIYIPASITEFPGGVTENMAVWVIYKGSRAEEYAKARNYTIEFVYNEP